MTHISVIGAGAWGTALALAAHRGGNDVSLWSPFEDEIDIIKNQHSHPEKLPGVTIPAEVNPTSDTERACQDADIVVLSVPAQKMRDVCHFIRPFMKEDTPVVITSKGIENNSNLLMSQVVSDVLNLNPIAVLSGPSFAIEVAHNMPTAVTIASNHSAMAEQICKAYNSTHFRPYLSTDMIGVQLGGALKNVIAIACGILEGLDLGHNARAATLTRGIAEITRLGVAMGAHPETFLGLSGIGDLTLTALSPKSRNMSFGYAVGQGKSLDELLEKDTLTEGVFTVQSAVDLADSFEVEMPITFAVHRLINKQEKLEDLMDDILSRPLREELS